VPAISTRNDDTLNCATGVTPVRDSTQQRDASATAHSASHYRSGLLFGLFAYIWWGLVPLYFDALKDAGVPAWEILAHRILWSLPVVLICTALTGNWLEVFEVLRSRRLMLTLLLSALLLTCNWMLYIYAAVSDRVTEASLGYFMMPLVNAALATLFFKEKLRPAHYPALALIAASVAIPSIVGGYLPWLAVSLTVSFGLYSLVRKKAPVDSLTGLTVESLLLLLPSAAYLLYLSAQGRNHMGPNWSTNGLIMFSGIVTVVPLLAFNISIRRIPLLAVSFLQFLSPTTQLLLAIYVIKRETLTPAMLAAFACVWSAVAIFVADALWQARSRRSAPREETVTAA